MAGLNKKSEECESCGFATEYLKHYRCHRIINPNDGKWLCRLCAGTMAGNAVDYPSQYPDAHIMQCICYCANAILEKLEAIHGSK